MDPLTSRHSTEVREGLGDRFKEVSGSGYRIRDLPTQLRPREEMARVGAEHVADDVLIAVLLRTGTAGVNASDLARGLLQRYRSLTGLAAAPVEELRGVKGIGRVKAQMLKAALEIGRRLTDERLPGRVRVTQPAEAAALVREEARALDHEEFWVLYLDARNALKTSPVSVSRGLLDSSPVHPREVFKMAVHLVAAAVILVHNHPSGDPSPSAEDLQITRQLVAAGKVMDLKVLDHVILGKARAGSERDFVSLREEGLVDFS